MNITITAVDTASITNLHLVDYVAATESGYCEIFARLSQVEHLREVARPSRLSIKMVTSLTDVVILSQTVFGTL